MKLMKVPGKRKPARVAELKDAEPIVKRIMKEEREFLSKLSNF